MNKIASLIPEFVDAIPAKIESGKLYISMEFATAVHSCACGCGMEVVTPFSPTDWNLTFDGVSVSLAPSIGNWSFPCRSHYWVRRNQIQWAGDWSDEEIAAGRASDKRNKDRHFASSSSKPPASTQSTERGFWSRVKRWFSS